MTTTKTIYDAYQTDAGLETEGAWTDLRGGARVKIRAEASVFVREKARALDKKYRAIMITEGGLPPDVQDTRDTELCATAILVAWENVTDKTGTVLPFTVDNARATLTALPRMRQDILYAARIDETFRAQQQEVMAGNSPQPSATATG